MPRRYRVFLWALPALFVSWLTLTFVDPDPGGQVTETIGLGYFFGSLFAHTTLAAAWAAFGPGSLLFRIPLSLGWIGALAVGIAINIALNGGPNGAALVLGMCFLGQWLLLQIPFWGLILGFRLRLQHADDVQLADDRRRYQFGIRQLVLVTTITGVMLGIVRLVLILIPQDFPGFGGDIPIFVFLSVAAVLVTFPLILAALLRRLAVRGVLIALGLIAIATILESFAHQGLGGRGPGLIDFIAINGFNSAFILIVTAIVRFNGYSLSRSVTNDANASST